MKAAHHRPALLMLALEPRWVFDGAVVAAADHAAEAVAAVKAAVADTPPATQVRAADPARDGGKKEVAFVDTSVTNWQALVVGIRPGVEIDLIDGGQNGLAQMALWAETHSGYDAIHILSHGDEATVRLGSETLTEAGLSDPTTRAELAEIGTALKAGGDLMLYGCDVAKGADGQVFITDLAVATGATVAASTDLTGAAALGGDWTLEAATGSVAVAGVVSSDADWSGLLSIDQTGLVADIYSSAQSTGGVTPTTGVYQHYTYSFVATQTSTMVSFLFREDPGYFSFDDVTVTAGGGSNLVVNGTFEGGSGTTANQPAGWSLIGTQGLRAAGVLQSSGGNAAAGCWYDGAVGGFDGITQSITTTIGQTYTISFWLKADSWANTQASTTDPSAGSITEVLVYAGSLPSGFTVDGVPYSGGGASMSWASSAVSESYTDTAATDSFPAATGTLSTSNAAASVTYGIQGGTVASGHSTLTGSYGTLDVNTATGAYSYTPNSTSINALSAGSTPTDVFTVTAGDGTTALTQTFTVSITGADDQPVVTAGGTATYVEAAGGGTGAAIAAHGSTAISVTDADNSTASSASVTISSGYVAGDSLSFTSAGAGTMGNITATGFDATTHTLTLSSSGGTATLAQWAAALNAVTFVSTSHDPGSGDRVIGWTVSDGTLSSTAATSTVHVTPVNDAPTLTASGATSSLDHVATPVALFSGAALDTVEAGQTITQLTLSVSGVHDGVNECLRVDGTLVTLTDGTSGTTTANGVAYLVAVSGTTATVTLSKSDTPAHWQSLVNALAYEYESTAAAVTSGDRVVTLTRVTDSGGTANGGVASTTLAIAATVQVTANDTPVLSGGSSLGYVFDSASHAISGITLTDSMHAAQVSMVVSALSGSVSVSPSSLVSGNGSRSLTLTGTVAEVNALLATLGYTAASVGSDVVTVTVDDGGSALLGGAKSASETIAVTVRAPPTIPLTTTVPTPQPVAPVAETAAPTPSAPFLTLTPPSQSGGGTSSESLAALSQTLSGVLGGSTGAASSVASSSSTSTAGGDSSATTSRDTAFTGGGTTSTETGTGTASAASVSSSALAATLQGLSDGTVQSGGGAYDAAMTNALAQGRSAAEAVSLAQQAAAQAVAMANADSGRSDAGAVLNATLASLSGSSDGTAGGSAGSASAAALANALAQGRPVTEATRMAQQAAAALADDSGTPESAIASGADTGTALGAMTRGLSATAAAAFEQTLGAELARGRSMAEAAAAAQVAAAAGGGISATAQALGDLASGNLDRLMAGLSGSAAAAFEKALSGVLSRGGDPATAIALARTAARDAGERDQASATNPFAGLASGAAGADPRPAYDRALGAALMAGLPLDAAQARARDAVRVMNAATGANPAESLAGGRDPAQSLGAKGNDPVFARAFSRAIAAGKDVRSAIALGDKAMAEAKARGDVPDTLPAALASGRGIDPSEEPHSGRLSGAAKTLFENVMGRTLATGGSLGDAIARANAAVREFQSMEARGSEQGVVPAEPPPPDRVRLRRMP